MKREVRTFSGAQLRAKDTEKPGASGYAAVFNQVTDLGWFKETIKPGAFSRALTEKQDVRCLVNHDPNLVLGRTKSKTLTLSEDSHGLAFDCDFPETNAATDLRTLLQRGDIDQCSFGFVVTKQTWTEEKVGDDYEQTRIIEDLDLFDVSIVTYPAYEGTSAEARSKFLFPDGDPEDVLQHRSKRNAKCECDCDECMDGDCSDCSDPDCDDPNCDGHERSLTKNISGVEYPATCFALVVDPADVRTWKLRISEPGDEEKTRGHVRNSIARFNQTKIADEKRAEVWAAIVAAAKANGVNVSEQDSRKWKLSDTQVRDLNGNVPDKTDLGTEEIERMRMRSRAVAASL